MKEFNIKLNSVAELVILKNALVNYKKAPFLSKQEIKLVEKLLDEINEL
tara:strand:+ start:507 stop:653 length:147 start_codon:yes stop_codon:yes gene_type:complete